MDGFRFDLMGLLDVKLVKSAVPYFSDLADCLRGLGEAGVDFLRRPTEGSG